MINGFATLKDMLCRITELTIPSPKDTFLLSTDASGDGIGAVLSVKRQGQVLPSAYFSRKLTEPEKNYAITELECLKATEHFGHYLIGRPFLIQTDHKALEALQTSKKLTGRLARWALLMQQYNYKVAFRPGKTHQDADGLSRQSWQTEDEPVGDPDEDVKLKGGGHVEGRPPQIKE